MPTFNVSLVLSSSNQINHNYRRYIVSGRKTYSEIHIRCTQIKGCQSTRFFYSTSADVFVCDKSGVAGKSDQFKHRRTWLRNRFCVTWRATNISLKEATRWSTRGHDILTDLLLSVKLSHTIHENGFLLIRLRQITYCPPIFIDRSYKCYWSQIGSVIVITSIFSDSAEQQ